MYVYREGWKELFFLGGGCYVVMTGGGFGIYLKQGGSSGRWK